MSKGNELKFKVGAVTNTEREQGNEGGKNRDHTRNGMAVAHKSLDVMSVLPAPLMLGSGRREARAPCWVRCSEFT